MSNWFGGPVVGHDESFRTFTPPLGPPPRLARPVFSILIKTMKWKRSHTSLLAQLAFVPFSLASNLSFLARHRHLFELQIQVLCFLISSYIYQREVMFHFPTVFIHRPHWRGENTVRAFSFFSSRLGAVRVTSGVVRTQGHVPRLLPLLLARWP